MSGKLKHGHAIGYGTSPEYRTWTAMRNRCHNRRNKSYPRYGGRGVRVCARWNDFAAFLEDMGQRPSRLHTLERGNNDGPYSPDNCRWATAKEQARNRRTSRRLAAFGRTQTVAAWAEETGLKPGTIHQRIDSYGWDVERALSSRLERQTKLTARGETRSVSDWAKLAGIHPATIRYRLKKGWDTERAVFTAA